MEVEGSSGSDLTAHDRRLALVALIVVLVVLLGLGAVLDRVTTNAVATPAVAPPAVPFPRTVTDDFATRPGPGLGRTPTGQRWAAVRGEWVMADGSARVAVPAPLGSNVALVRVGRGAGSVSVTAQTITKGMGLAFRCRDLLDCWTLTAVPEFGTWNLTKVKSAVPADMGNVGQAPIASGTRVRVDMDAQGFEVFVNDVSLRRVDDPGPDSINDAPRAGLVVNPEAGATDGRFTEFSATQWNILGPDAAVHDDFDRPASDTLGRSSTGQRWTVASGQWGITDREAVLRSTPSDTPSVATIDVGRSEGWVQATATTAPQGFGVVFRYRDPRNYWRIVAVPDYATFNVFKVVNGRETKVTASGIGVVTYDKTNVTIGIRLEGDRFTFYVDGRDTGVTMRDPELRNARRAGLVVSSVKGTGLRVAGFAAGPLDAAGPP